MENFTAGVGKVPRNYVFELQETPEQWWIDYHWKNPDYIPYALDIEKWRDVYGWGTPEDRLALADSQGERRRPESFENFKLRLRVGGADPGSPDFRDPGYDFLTPYFGDEFRHVLVLSRIKRLLPRHPSPTRIEREKALAILRDSIAGGETEEETDLKLSGVSPALAAEVSERQSSHYSPLLEAPDAYRKFCRLSRLLERGWSAKEVMSEVLKFVNRYGPPWYAEMYDLYAPPYDPYLGPLTVDRILWHSLAMDSAAQTYRLLAESHNGISAMQMLRNHMTNLQNENRSYHIHARSVVKRGVFVEPTYTDGFPRMRDDNDVVQVAVAFMMSLVNEGLAIGSAATGLTAKTSNTTSAAWIPQYGYDNLLGAMWLQFYIQVLEHQQFKECANPNCRLLFETTRSDKKYCSKACGVSHYSREHRDSRNAVSENIL